MAGIRECSRPDDVHHQSEPRACWTSAGGPFKPPGPVIPNASYASACSKPDPLPDQPVWINPLARDIQNRRDCSVNAAIGHCVLKVVRQVAEPVKSLCRETALTDSDIG